MCGIAGVLGIALERARPAAERMRAALRHRGPDGEGLEVIQRTNGPGGAPAVLVHTRLAIIEPGPGGRQPMASGRPQVGEERRLRSALTPQAVDELVDPLWVTCNGEIYNYLELAAELRASGYPARTGSDTEVLLLAYRAWGSGAWDRLRGMYAACLLDPGRGRAVLVRDRLGIKPLYLARVPGGGLLFASELRALLAAGPDLVPARLRPSALTSFFAQGVVYGEESLVEGVELLPPGATLELDWQGRGRLSTTWSPPFLPPRSGRRRPTPRRADIAQELGRTLREAVACHLRSDVPVGLFLSSGVDSAALATIATEVSSGISTIGIGFDQPDYDESDGAAALASALGTTHRTVRLTGSEILAGLDDALAAVDQPTVDGFNTFFVSRAARQQDLKVVLSGLGGDELFAGYASFHDVPRALRLRGALGLRPVREALRLASLSRTRAGVKLGALAERGAGLDAVGLTLLRRELLLPADRRRLRPLGDGGLTGIPAGEEARLRAGTVGLDPVNQVSYLELTGYMRHMLLRDADVFSMAHGLELRVPLLDHALVEQVVALPGAWKVGGRTSKALLREAVGPRLPSRLLSKTKRGFTFPWGPWLRGPLRERARAAVHDASAWVDVGVDAGVTVRLWERFEDGDPAVAPLAILALIVLRDHTQRHGLRV